MEMKALMEVRLIVIFANIYRLAGLTTESTFQDLQTAIHLHTGLVPERQRIILVGNEVLE